MSRPKGPWRAAFLECLKKSGDEYRCADLCGITDSGLRKAKSRDPEFRAEVERARRSFEARFADSSVRRQARVSQTAF